VIKGLLLIGALGISLMALLETVEMTTGHHVGIPSRALYWGADTD
jgi:hypothetical protein